MKFASIALQLGLIFSSMSCLASAPALHDGTFIGNAVGRNGPLTVEMTIRNGKIDQVKVPSHHESVGVSDAAIKNIPQDIVKHQSLAVDTVSGATLTSKAILSGAKTALMKATSDITPFLVPLRISKQDKKRKTEQFDVIVIGAGSAGMMAALSAQKAGKKVLILEKQGMLGGGDSMNISTGVTGGGSEVIAKLGIQHATAEDFYQSLIAQTESKKVPANREMLRTYALRTPEVIDDLVSWGVPFTRFDINRFMHLTSDGSAPGPHIIRALSGQLMHHHIEYRLNSPVQALLGTPAQITGVTVKDRNGIYQIDAKAIVLATGGFAANHKLLAQYQPQWVGRPTTGASSLTGDGITMAVPYGAATSCMDQIKVNYLCHQLTPKEGVSLTAITPYTALVNHEGQRFVDEGHPSINFKSIAEMKQPKHEAYAIIDNKAMSSLKLMQNYRDAGYFIQATSLEALADKLEVNKSNFLKAMKGYTSTPLGEKDAAFGRKMVHSIAQAPFYAALVTPSMQSTYGGLRTDSKAHVLNKEGKPIAGLYAAGSVSGHECYANEIGFAAVIALTFGRIAGETAAADMH